MDVDPPLAARLARTPPLGVEDLEGIVGRPPPLVLAKQLDALDEGCTRIVTTSPLAGVGFRDRRGRSRTTLVGGPPGSFGVNSPTRISVDLDTEPIDPVRGSGVSFVFLLPGIGETLRLNGSAAGRSGDRLLVDVGEVYVHCARCVMRSRLWDGPHSRPTATPAPGVVDPVVGLAGPLAPAAITAFLASAPFLVVSSWDADGSSDTSPRGDAPGFLHVLDANTLVIPDRKGNRRADTFHNLLGDDRVSLAAVVPGRLDVLHMSGTGRLAEEPALLSATALNGRSPHAVLLVDVEHAELADNRALRRSRVWDPSTHVDRREVPDLMALSTRHVTAGSVRGVPAPLRLLLAPLGAFPRLIRRLIDLGYRRSLRAEGYGDGSTARSRRVAVRVLARLLAGPRASSRSAQLEQHGRQRIDRETDLVDRRDQRR